MNYSLILPLLALIGFFWFMSRQQKKQRERQQQMQSNLKKGTPIVTIGGLHAVVDSVDQEKRTVDLDAEGVILTFDLNAIRTVAQDAAPAADSKPAEDKAPEAKSADQASDAKLAESKSADQGSADKDQEKKD
ncbi:preprotein translocase subunit YajC [Lactobacillaceae bacterium L1_55_11]|nr:preprotein translocase subunit YajC [Lactobacillaceae bacterium L1_55_11]